ncbi:MAG: hypothetical protein H5U38_15900, partial [Calditrichaeota bacterium]|nr:hypothetical protein [Calditrichota bacterium]
MKMVRSLALCLLCVALSLLAAARAQAQVDLQARVVHLPVTSAFAGEPVELVIKIEGTQQRAMEARIYYRRPEEQGYRYVEMREGVDQWVGEIPARDVVAPRIEYFISVVLDAETILTYPEFNPYYEPLQVLVAERPSKPEARPKVSYSELELMVLSPQPDEKVAAHEVVVAFSLRGDPAQVDSSSYRLLLDDRDVTRRAEVSSALVTFVPKRLPPGRHTAELRGTDRNGRPLQPARVSFVVTSGGLASAAREFSGRVYADLRYEDVSTITEETYQTGGSLAGRYGALSYRTDLFLTSREKKDAQPRNRYSLRLELPWLGVQVGDANPRFNDLVLWGKRVRGVYGYLHTGVINVDIVYGETYRAVEGRGDSTGVQRFGTYRQMLYGVRPSFGRPNRFLLGLNLLKVKDDTSSVVWGPSS